jgi:hypothetical protein
VTAVDVPPDKRWRFEVDGVALTVGHHANGRWEVLYGGFSRVVSDRLEDAIAVAAGADPNELWIGEISTLQCRHLRYRRSVIAPASTGRPQSCRRTRHSPLSVVRIR